MQKPPLFKKLVAYLLALSSTALAVGTPAGTVIQNIASMEYISEDGTPHETPSNPVTTTISSVCRPSVLPNGTVAAPGQSFTLLPGESALLKYTVSNSGNTNTPLQLTMQTVASSQFTPSNMAIYQDTNGNGVIDAGEPAISQLTLPNAGSAQVLVRVSTAVASRGAAYINLVASCTVSTDTGTVTEQDDDNIARIDLSNPSQFDIGKTFSPSEVGAGEETTVTIDAVNIGGPSGEVTVTDFLNTPAMRDFVFVSGSARSSGYAAASLEYTADGTTWSMNEPAAPAGVRLRARSVPAGGTLKLTFKLRAPATDVGTRRNIALLQGDGVTLEAPADITVKFYPVIALGPIGNPQANPGGEMSSSDRQEKTVVFVNQEVCFAHTVQNLGERDDTITTTGAVEKGAASIVFKDMSGNPIAQPFTVTLAPQATRDFQACYTPTQTGSAPEALKVVLTSKSSLGAADNSTVDVINRVVENTSKLIKSSDKGDQNLVAPGDEITYTLSFTNNQDFPLTNVVIRDELDNIRPPVQESSAGTAPMKAQNAANGLSALEFISADQGGTLEGTQVVWRFPAVQPGQTITLTVRAKVPASTPDGSTIVNSFTVSSDEISTPVPSNPVTNPVFNPENLEFSKTSTPSTVVVGEEITYIFRVRNGSPTSVLRLIKVTDILPTGLTYVEGSSTLDGAPITPVVDPANPRQYTWNIPGLAPGATAEVRFRALVTPNAPEQLRNNAKATAVQSGRETQAQTGSASNKILPLSFGPNNADIVGYVFLDRDRDGVYDYGLDVPCQNARVILANGRIVLTDAEGRYHFRNVREGEWALRLDPNSVVPQNLSVPQDAGREGSRLLYVRNLTSVDFPLAPDGGDIAVIRDTTLRIKGGPVEAQNTLTVQKKVFTTAEAGVYRVQLILSASAPLSALTLTDPLPAGAALVDGQNTMSLDPLPSGDRSVVYTFRWDGDVKGAVTDPTASWRY